MNKIILFTIFVLSLASIASGQALDKIVGRCSTPYSGLRSTVQIQQSGNIVHTPCGDRATVFNGSVEFTGINLLGVPRINGINYTSLTDFNAAPEYKTNTVTNTSGGGNYTFRIGGNKSFFEQVQQPFGSNNQVRLRTDELAPCCGGFGEFWLFSDVTHSYALLRAQRYIDMRSDDFFVSNFFADNKFLLWHQMDNVQSHPTEDTSQFRVGNFTDGNIYFQLHNATKTARLIGEKIIVRATLPAPVNANDACETGQETSDVNFLYKCIATDTWKRAALSTW